MNVMNDDSENNVCQRDMFQSNITLARRECQGPGIFGSNVAQFIYKQIILQIIFNVYLYVII